ncbi:tyrosinase family protein [Methylorubrum sp. SB2]|uniref:tyrosinase family protein n=1 Tax=Methylorubrum subtropicum TaxID=3138812 RepID=UPI00313A9ECC
MKAPDQVALAVWAQCQHGTPWFFAWHRLYLFYFEKQLQAASGDPTLRLPYWDYTNPAQLAMPAEFAQPSYKDASGNDQPNPLFEPRRAPGWQQGDETLDTNSTNIDGQLTQSNFGGYQSGIEQNVHGYIHCTVATTCPVVNMGAVPYSANDPIFWVHHANIDRMWSCWSNMTGHKNPSDSSFTNKSYSFVDASGQQVTVKVGDLFNGGLIDYKYEQETNCARSGVKLAANAEGARVQGAQSPKVLEMIERRPVLNKSTEPVQIKAATTKVNVELQKANDLKPLVDLALRADAPPSTRTHLILSGITFASPPGAQFYVYLENPADPNRREYAGTVNFFGAMSGEEHTGHQHGADMDAASGMTRDFDVTEALRKLGSGKPDLNAVTVSFEATNGRVGSKETPKINENAGLTVKSVDFRLTPSE